MVPVRRCRGRSDWKGRSTATRHQRAEALAAAEQASRAKDNFLARVSHELRSPPQVALSATEVLRRLPDTPVAARKFIDRLAHAINPQARMINELLAADVAATAQRGMSAHLAKPVDAAAVAAARKRLPAAGLVIQSR